MFLCLQGCIESSDMIDLILSLDYELFGNGSGDVRRDMIEPTQRLLKMCDRHNAKLTIMFEVGEYWAIKQAEETGSLCLGYSPAREIERQLQDAVSRGHDVQLHLHPWWIGASFESGHWRLQPEIRRITDLPKGIDSICEFDSLLSVLEKGKKTIEEIICPVDSNYKCLIYRAAMFWGQPSQGLIDGLKRAGLLADTSVIPGLHEKAPVQTDYRFTPASFGYWWTRADDIARSGQSGENIIEFPVYSKVRPYVCNFKWTKLVTTLKRRRVEKGNMNSHGMMEARQSTDSMAKVLQKLFTRQPIKYDFCKLSVAEMIQWLKPLIQNDMQEEEDAIQPIVMLGHSKDFWNDRNLASFLDWLNKNGEKKVRFSTFLEVIRLIQGSE